MGFLDDISRNSNLDASQLSSINGLLLERLRLGVVEILLRCAMDSGLDSDCIDSIATAICDFVVKHRDELPCEMDMFQPDPLF